MTAPDPYRQEEHKTIRVTGPQQPPAGLAKYFSYALKRLDFLEYGDPSEFLKKLGLPCSPIALSDAWTPPLFSKYLEQSDDINYEGLLKDPASCLVVLADPGHGKSTLARYLTCKFIRDYQEGKLANFGVYVPLSLLRTEDLSDHRAVAVCAAAFVNLDGDEDVVATLAQYLPSAMIFFDGLDELPTARRGGSDHSIAVRAEAQELISSLIYPHPVSGVMVNGIRCMVTCRKADYFENATTQLSAPHYILAPFTPRQRDNAIVRWHDAVCRKIDKSPPTERLTSEKMTERAAAIQSTLREHADLGELCLSPLMLSILQTVYLNKWDLPASVSQLCSRAVELMLVDRQPGPDTSPLQPNYQEWIRSVVTELAWELQENAVATGRKGFDSGQLRLIVGRCASISRQNAKGQFEDAVTSVCTFMERGHGIIVALKADHFDFAHAMLREVMAGRKLDNLLLDQRKIYALDENWAGPVRYWAGLLAEKSSGAAEISTLIDELQPEVDGGCLSAVTARAEMLVEVCLVQQPEKLPLRLKQLIPIVRDDLIAALERADVPKLTRFRIGDLLAVLGDPNEALPWKERMLNIEAANYMIGAPEPHKTKIDKYTACSSAPVISGDLNAYSIGRNLVTNSDFSIFINEGGYKTERFWRSEIAWKWASGDQSTLHSLTDRARQVAGIHFSSELASQRFGQDDIPDRCAQMIDRSLPLYWCDPSFNRPNQPVVGVNWWEASAYCVWLTERLISSGDLTQDKVVRLPFETEWETVARLCGDGVYPWTCGEPSDRAHVRITAGEDGAAQFLRSCAVGLFKCTPSKLPIFDLVGNVWEWSASQRRSYDAATFTQKLDPTSDSDRVARGSSWLSREREASKITFRSFDPPYNAYDDLGFRIVCASEGE